MNGLQGPKPVRILSANLHTTSNPAVVVPWLWVNAALHRVDAMTLQEVTPRHARWLRRRPGWVLVKNPDTQEALYVRRRHSAAYRAPRLLDTGWERRRTEGMHPGRALPMATMRGWLVVGSVHLPPNWLTGPHDRQVAGMACLSEMSDHVPAHVPVYLDGDWNAKPTARELVSWRRQNRLPVTEGHRIVHAAARRAIAEPWVNLGRAPGMDHDAHLAEVTPL